MVNMKFYFFESCGKRVTELDLDAGAARDKKLKGVYCTGCAAGVLTMETLPLTKEQARELLDVPGGDSQSQPTGSRKRPSGIAITPVRHRGPKPFSIESKAPYSNPPTHKTKRPSSSVTG